MGMFAKAVHAKRAMAAKKVSRIAKRAGMPALAKAAKTATRFHAAKAARS